MTDYFRTQAIGVKSISLLLISLLFTALVANAQYSGFVGDQFTIPDPPDRMGYTAMNATFGTTSPHLYVSAYGTVQIRSYFTGSELVFCNVLYVRSDGSYGSNIPATLNYYVTCKPRTITGLPNSVTMEDGEEKTLNWSISPYSASVKITWESSNSNVVSVNSNGKLKAKSPGFATVTAQNNSGPDEYIYVTVNENKKVSLTASPSSSAVFEGTVVKLTSNVTGTDIYYTLDGSTPSRGSTKYTSAGITINESCTLKAIGYKEDYETSDVLTVTYTVAENSTCADVLAGVDGNVYRVIGTVKSITNTVYGNWYLKDATGEIFIYGTRDQSGNTGQNNSIEAWGIETDDIITVEGPRNTYNGLVELVDVNVISLQKATEGIQVTFADGHHVAGYATFYSSVSAYTLPNGLLAQVVTGATNNKLTYKTIADGSASGVIPKGTAVMLVSDKKQAGTFTLTSSESTATYNSTNLLRGSDEATTTTGDGLHYKLSNGPSNTGWSDVFGWYWGAQNGAPFQIEGHKAWLVVPSTNRSRAAGFTIDGDATELEVIEQEVSTMNHYYDLQGRRVNHQPTRKGVYIKNGKKMIVK